MNLIPKIKPAEHCGHQPPRYSDHTPSTECVLRPGHTGSHADDNGMRWWETSYAPGPSCTHSDAIMRLYPRRTLWGRKRWWYDCSACGTTDGPFADQQAAIGDVGRHAAERHTPVPHHCGADQEPDDTDLTEADVDQMMADGSADPQHVAPEFFEQLHATTAVEGDAAVLDALDGRPRPDTVLTFDGQLTDEEYEEMKRRWIRVHNGGRPLAFLDVAPVVRPKRDREMEQLRDQLGEARTALATQKAISADLRVENKARGEKLARLTAGEKPYIHEHTEATPAQWIWLWNRATPEERLDMASRIQDAFARSSTCFMARHEARLSNLAQELRHEQEQRDDLRRRLGDTSDAYSRVDTQRAALAATLREVLNAFASVTSPTSAAVMGYQAPPIHPQDFDRWRAVLEQPAAEEQL